MKALDVSETGRFTTLAGIYNAGRPGYPPEVADFIYQGTAPEKLVVADLGAGTGTSSVLLAERGASVFAVEPNAAMRAKAKAAPGVSWIDGTAEATTLPDASVDVVTAFQAFHWFERPAIFTEMVRILKPGGRAAVVFYERDEQDPFALAYGKIVRAFATDATEQQRADALEAFATYAGWKRVRRASIPNVQTFDRAGMDDRVRSSSYLPHTGPDSERLHQAVEAMFVQFARDGRATMALQNLVVVGEP